MISAKMLACLGMIAFTLPASAATVSGQSNTPPAQTQHGRGRAPANASPSRTAVQLQSRPGTPLDRAATQLVARDMSDSSRAEQSLVLTGTAALGAAKDPLAIFVQVQSARECGSSGCSTSVYFRDRKVLDSVSGQIFTDSRRHKGMRDLIVGDSSERYIWNGSAYQTTQPAPAVNLRPTRPRHQ